MVKDKKNDEQSPGTRYWARPKIPIAFRMDADLVERAKEVARQKKIPLVALVSAGIEREIYAATRG